MAAVYRFDRFELRCSERELLAENGRRIRLGSRTVDLLAALIDGAGQAIDKQRLLRRVWPDAVVGENSLEVQLSLLRRLLGRRAIVSVRGHGYRFTMPIHPVHAPSTACIDDKGARSAALPWAPPSLRGREQDLADLIATLDRHRLVTVTGSTGVGKTALALTAVHTRLAAQGEQAVWVDLSQVALPGLVPRLVAQALTMDSTSDADMLPSLVAQMANAEMLLALDNAEHVLGETARLVHALMAGAPRVRVLVTSQAPLHVGSERVFRLDPLSVPPLGASPEQAMRHGAVALFVDQVRMTGNVFALDETNSGSVINLCRRLDGVPLSIKLAASRVELFGVEGVHRRIGDRFRLLKTNAPGVPSRHRTLAAALEWSHGLLSSQEQALFRRMSVFAGGFSLMLATDVAQDGQLDPGGIEDTLQGLVEHSLIVVDPGEPPRYRMLEGAREYALLQLRISQEEQSTRRRHARALLALFTRLDNAFWAMDRASIEHMSAHAAELANLRAALDWCLANDTVLGVQILGAANDFFDGMGLLFEARERLALFAPFADESVPAASLASFRMHRGRLLRLADNASALELVQSAAAIFRRLGDQPRLYFALCYITLIAGQLSPQQGRRTLDELVAMEQPGWQARLLCQRYCAEGMVLDMEGHPEQARAAHERYVTLARQAGCAVGNGVVNLAFATLATGNTASAIALLREVVKEKGPQRRFGYAHMFALGVLCTALLLEERLVEARDAMRGYFDACREKRAWDRLAMYSDLYPAFAAADGRIEHAARLLGFADRTRAAVGQRSRLGMMMHERAMSAIGAHLDVAAIAAHRAKGQDLGAEDVMRLTLAAPPLAADTGPTAPRP